MGLQAAGTLLAVDIERGSSEATATASRVPVMSSSALSRVGFCLL